MALSVKLTFSFLTSYWLNNYLSLYFKSQGYLAERKCSAIWGDYKSIKIRTNQIKCWFLRRGENRVPMKKPLEAE